MANISPTLRLQKLKSVIGHSRSMGEAMRSVGYSKAYAEEPHQLRATIGFKKVMEPYLAKLEKERNRIIDEMMIKDLNSVEYKDLGSTMEKLDKMINLATGKPTEIVQGTMSTLDDAELNRIAAGSTN